MKRKIVARLLSMVTGVAWISLGTVCFPGNTYLPGTAYAAEQKEGTVKDTNELYVQDGAKDDLYIDAALTQRDELRSAQVAVHAVVPENFGMQAIYADIRCVDTENVYRFTLFADNGYYQYAFVEPADKYTMLSAGVVGDAQNLYDFSLPEDWGLAMGEAAEIQVELHNRQEVENMIEQKKGTLEIASEDSFADDNQLEPNGKFDVSHEDEAGRVIEGDGEDETGGLYSITEESMTAAIGVGVFLTILVLAAAIYVRIYFLKQIPPVTDYRIRE